MFLCPKSMRLNEFRAVSVPRNKDLFARVGGRIPTLGTGGFTAEIGKNKLDVLADSEAALLEEYQQVLKEGRIPLAEDI